MDDKEIKQILGELAGAASLCWQPKATGVFDPEQANKFVDGYSLKISSLLDKAVFEEREQAKYEELNWILSHIIFKNDKDQRVFTNAIRGRMRAIKALNSKEGANAST